MSSNDPSSSTGVFGSDENTTIRRNSKRPKYSKFSQQELPACKPILTPKWVISILLLIGVVFIPIGLVSLLASRDVVEIIDRYDVECIPNNSTNDKIGYITNKNQDKTCVRTLRVPKKMEQPIYVYYQLENFYQNHRRYVKSRSDQQLKSSSNVDDTGSCEPEDFANGKPIVPCGLIAWSLFNDTYIFASNNQELVVNKKGISWKSDRDHKFGKDVFPSNFQNGTLIGGGSLTNVSLSEQEDLIVWMRTAALPTFRKLYGKIERDLMEGEIINVTLQNNYNTYSFDGKKKLVLSTTSWIGGKNDFLGIAYLTVGGLCFFLALAFMIVYLVKPRQLGDPTYLSWNRNPGGN
ncbi:ALA-interacting subunit 1-like [Nicotiana tabacum]|uniref:ALA-interacting subunit n=1 Tax=Nicotiana tabacum TaxID=4097 RepID=A0A1S3WYB2_TOBAC|nr:PREDICTED: ALA-interacting subunit 1-like [Nicotiana tabacum]